MALYLKQLAARNQTTAATASFVNVMEGIEGAAVFGYNVEATSIQRASNQRQVIRERHTLDLRVIDDGGTNANFLQTAMMNRNLVQIAGISDDSFLMWDEGTLITAPQQYDQIVARSILATVDAVPGYNGAAPLNKVPVYAGGNALNVYNVLAGSASLLNGFTTSGTITTSQTGGVQTVTRGADVSADFFSQPLLFPFVNARLTFSVDVTTASGTYTLAINFLDAAGLFITATSTIASGTGRKSVSVTVPANTIFVSVRLVPNTTLGTTVAFQLPALRLNGETAYVD
jgi:hypothetical protein